MKVLAAMSGGIDSSVAAYLLQKAGHDVTGVFMRNGVETAKSTQRSCCSIEDAYDARRIADRLGIPFYAINLSEGFGALIDRFVDQYDRGRTPNPCIECNRDLKLGKLFDYARAVGAERVATGHYARLHVTGGRPVLRRAADAAKDQTYMLFAVRPEFLRRALFPLGELSKEHVRRIARDMGWAIADKPDSQEICFVPGNDYRELLRERLGDRMRPGPVETADGAVVGRHDGFQGVTLGQRKGLGLALGRRMYVVGVDRRTNTVTLGEEEKLFRRRFRASGINWLSIDPPSPGTVLSAAVKIRRTHEPAPAQIRAAGTGEAEVTFDEPQKMIVPGQGAAFYDKDVLLGGGWIDWVEPHPSR